MKNSTIKRVNSLGTVGYVMSILLIICSISCMVITAIGTAGAIAISKESVTVRTSSDFYVASSGNILDRLNRFIKVGGVEDLNSLITEDGEAIAVEDNDLSQISVTKEGNGLNISAKTNEITFSIKRIIASLVAMFVFLGALTVTLHFAKGLMKALKNCETPFDGEVIKHMTRFAYGLLVTLIVNIIGSGIWPDLATGSDFSPTVNIGSIFLAAAVFMLISVFKYGAELQRQSDETL